MLPIYEAIDLLEIISENSGHTKPWVVLADTPYGLKPFVTKLYSTAQVDKFHCVTNEIICNLLAGEFDLNVPQCVFIDIPEYLSVKLSPEAQLQYNGADPRLKFATSLIPSYKSAIPSLPKPYFQQRIDLDTLYAFDNLIRNADRGSPKSNLLLTTSDSFLIDHELTFMEKDILNIDLNRLQLEDKFTRYHLFYQHLKRTKHKNKQFFFNDFSEYVKMLNINKLTTYFNQIKAEGFNDFSQPICNWVNYVKQNRTIFVDKLKGSLQ